MTESALMRAFYRGSVLLLATLGLALLLWQVPTTLISILLATILAAGMLPLVHLATASERVRTFWWRPSPALIILLLYVLAGVTVLSLGALFITIVIDELVALSLRLPDYTSFLQAWLTGVLQAAPWLSALHPDAPIADLTPNITRAVGGLLGNSLAVAGGLLGALGHVLNLVFVLVIALYLCVDGKVVGSYLLVFFPVERQPQVGRMANSISWRLGRWVQAQILLCGIVGLGAGVGLGLLGVPYAPLLGLLWALAEFVPGIGPLVALIPSIALGFSVSPLIGGLSTVFCLAWSQLESNVIAPRVMGRAVELHPLAVLLAVMIGSELLGITGAVLAIPVAASAAVILDELRTERLRQLAAGPEVVQTASPNVREAFAAHRS